MLLEPGPGSRIKVMVESADGEPDHLTFVRADDHPAANVTPADALSGYDIDSARWWCEDGIWDRLLSWEGIAAIDGFLQVEIIHGAG